MSPPNNYLSNFLAHGYQIIQELGHNLNGGRVTYLVKEVATEQLAVIKQFQFARIGANWSGYYAVQREIKVLQQLNHPGIPKYLSSFETSDGFCLVQEYKNAQPLAAKRSFNSDEIKEITTKTLVILIYLQSLSPPVIHRDLKPENILVDDELNVYLVDFGLARIGGEDLSMSSVVVGTTGFMPPEQLLNQKLSKASDLYGLGASIVCLLSGIKSSALSNYIDETYSINIEKLLHSSVDFSFREWLKKLIAPRLSARFSNARIALEALQQLDVTLSSTDNDDSLSEINSTQISTTATAIAITAVAGVVVAGVIGFGTFSVLKILISTPNGGNLVATIFQIHKNTSAIALILILPFSIHQYRQGEPIEKSFAPVAMVLFLCVSSNIMLKLFLGIN